MPFNSICFETLSFFPLSPFFLFAMQKGGEAMPPRSSPPGVTGPDFVKLISTDVFKEGRET